MENILQLMPEAELEEAQYLHSLLKDKSETDIRNFINIYRTRRRDTQLVLLTALLGFVGFAGIHRFLINHIGMGILYFFTGGLCLIGTIVDLVNHKSLAFEYNQRVAMQVAGLFR
ncbi:MAG: TM2 domain-containing protein [Bacteroidales bacterium]|nr:TM2 domain-containing protein [Bacteroidales bacterium]